MIRIVFKNLDESELAKDVVYERIQTTIERFPDLEDHRLTVALSMDNSPLKPGPDLFKAKLLIDGKKYRSNGVLVIRPRLRKTQIFMVH